MVTIEKRKNVMWLNIGPHRGILRIGIYKEPSKNAITVQLEILKKALGSDKTNEMLTKLSKITGFQWISERIDLSKPFIWIYIKDAIAEEPDYNQTKKGLCKWILELNEALKH